MTSSSTSSTRGVNQRPPTHTVLTCSTGPLVPVRVNRSVISAGRPHCGQRTNILANSFRIVFTEKGEASVSGESPTAGIRRMGASVAAGLRAVSAVCARRLTERARCSLAAGALLPA
jgi:hypothetical protein